MNKTLIKRYINKRLVYYPSKEFPQYKCPKVILGKRPGSIVNLEENREKELSQPPSLHVSKFFFDISIPNKGLYMIKFISEFPVPIYNKLRWIKCCDKFGVVDKEDRDRLYFLLDVFLPWTGRAIEIDGEQHEFRKEYDAARDLYIKEELGIDTIRLKEYGTSGSKDFVEQYIIFPELNSPLPSPFLIDYEEGMINFFITKYKDEVWVIDKILEMGYKDRILNFNNLDFYKFTEGKVYTTKPYLDEFNDILKICLRQEVRIL